MKKLFPAALFMLCLSMFSISVTAQIRKIPSTVTDAFKEKYPDATSVEWRDKVSVFSAIFVNDGVTYEARYNSKGEWLNTENEITTEDLPEAVQEGFDKSKYADWSIEKVHQIVLPRDITQYRLHVGKSDLQKKNLLFNSKGRMLKDKITL